MRLNITPISHDSLNCQEVLLLSLSKFWERGNVLMYTESWGFFYTPYNAEEPVIFGKRFGSNDTKWRSNLSLYHGVQTSNWSTDKTAAEILRIAQEELEEQRPLPIIMDYFWCPWVTEFYQKFHGGAGGLPHTCMIVGIEGNDLVCIDPMFASEQVLLPLDHFEAGCGGYMKVSLAEEPQWPAWQDVLPRSLAHLGEQGSDVFDQIRQFANEFEAYIDIRFESVGFEHKPAFSPMLFKLKLVGFGRHKLSMLLTELGNRESIPELLEFADRMWKAGDEWNRISLNLMKAFYTKKPAATLEKVVGLLRACADVEEELARDMKQFLAQNEHSRVMG